MGSLSFAWSITAQGDGHEDNLSAVCRPLTKGAQAYSHYVHNNTTRRFPTIGLALRPITLPPLGFHISSHIEQGSTPKCLRRKMPQAVAGSTWKVLHRLARLHAKEPGSLSTRMLSTCRTARILPWLD
ncbi:hypothetical protein HBI56_230260 [Parastagonospora nodorum]|nr:hypothetical protein HBH49_236180 [Parastagonospora nodorum]KAH4112434.1 hypothetical protein HBH47_226040 [Parastagonospora nodorum]KAH4181234.1 hypothetical protein HBH42_241230 [Parastagonospora nodorum]KAH4188977.1 hypothetical protein HBI95_225530 [Parastagonospora nodorum]KAH4336237.1 hypothetical protein HBH98_230600 [Parastagonospora nodorum]